MSPSPSPTKSGVVEPALPVNAWLLVDDSGDESFDDASRTSEADDEASSPEPVKKQLPRTWRSNAQKAHVSNAPPAQEIVTEDMAGLRASMKLQSGELSKAQLMTEQALERQARRTVHQQQETSMYKDELHRSLEDHVLDLQRRKREKAVADCEASRTELHQKLAADIRKLQNEMERIVELLETETRQRRYEIQVLETRLEDYKRTQQAGLDNVGELSERVEQRLIWWEQQKDGVARPSQTSRPSPAIESKQGRQDSASGHRSQ